MHLYEAHYRRQQRVTDARRALRRRIAGAWRAAGWGVKALAVLLIVWVWVLLAL